MRARSNFHVPLPADLHDELRSAARDTGIPATVLAREAIEEYLEGRRRLAVREAIGAYATGVAGSPEDLDAGLEAAALDLLAGTEG